MRGNNDLRPVKKGVNWIENQGEILYKMNKTVNNIFGETFTKSNPRISGTKRDRDKLIVSAERGGQLVHNIRIQLDRILKKRGSLPWNIPITMPKYGTYSPGLWSLHIFKPISIRNTLILTITFKYNTICVLRFNKWFIQNYNITVLAVHAEYMNYSIDYTWLVTVQKILLGSGGFWGEAPKLRIHWRGAPRFCQFVEGIPKFCQIIIIKKLK